MTDCPLTPITGKLNIEGASPLILTTFHEKLLLDAEREKAEGRPEMAVILANAAAEVFTEAIITKLFEARNCADLVEPLLGLFQSIDICNERFRGIYNAMSGDKIQSEKRFWPDLKKQRKLRHEIIHRAARCTDADAKTSIDAVRQYILHVQRKTEHVPRTK